MERELVPMDKLQARLHTARAARELAAQKWDTTLAALKLDARAAASDGAPGLYRALFGNSRPKAKAPVTPEPTPVADTPETTPPAEKVA